MTPLPDVESKGLRILLVEDQAMIAMAMEQHLRDLGCAVVGPVARLDAALLLARQEELDAAILDVDLGGIKVYPVAEALRARSIPFMFLTGYSGSTLPVEWHAYLCFGKPFGRDELERFISSLPGR